MTGYKRFSKLAVDEIIPLFKRLDHEGFSQYAIDSINGISSSQKKPNLTEEEDFYVKILRHFGEINKSLETLEHIPIFISSFRKSKAYREAGITDTIHLRYHIEHYLQENYILLSRVQKFMGWLSHSLKNEGRLRESLFVSGLLKTFEDSMKNLKLVRGDHVHETRYDDNILNRATMLELAGQYKRDKDLSFGATMSYKLAKKEWSERIKKNNQDLRKSLDMIFEGLAPIVFPSPRE